MIVRCISSTGESLPSTSLDSARGVNSETEFPVTVGRTYSVYAMTLFLGIAWYYVLDDDGHAWPTWIPATVFKVVDGSLPASWKIGYFRFGAAEQYPILSFPEWADDHAFYERLVDRDPETVRIFAERRAEVEQVPHSSGS